MKKRHVTLFGMLLITLSTSTAFGAAAASKVSEGLGHFEAKEYQKAAAAFAEAETAEPDDPRILFNLACAKAAAGDQEKAIELYQQVAQSPELELAVLARYNLGCASVALARSVFGENPEEASEDARKQGMDHLAAAAGYFRDCIQMDGECDDARRNLEVLRVWTKHMKALWREKDRQKLRDSMDLMQFLKWLEGQEVELRGGVKTLSKAPDSPRRRQATYMTASQQRELKEEIPHLKNKIGQALTQAQAMPQGPRGSQSPQAMAAPAADVQKAAEVLTSLAGEAEGAMGKAAESLDARALDSAKTSQGAVLERLDDIHTAMLPYPQLVFQSVDKQKGLVEAVGAEVAPQEAGDAAKIAKEEEQGTEEGESGPQKETAVSNPADHGEPETVETGLDMNPAEMDTAADSPKVLFDAEETAWNQRFLARWTPVMIGKANQGLKQLESMPPVEEEMPQTLPPPPDKQPAEEPAAADEQTVESSATAQPEMTEQQKQLEAAKKQRENLKKSMQLAVQHGPKIIELTEDAAADLDQSRPEAAYPKQQEALRLLEEIAEPLKDQQQQQQQQQQHDQQQDQQQKQDQQQQEQQKQEQKKDEKDQKKDQEKKDQEKKDEQRKQDEKKDQGKEPPKPDSQEQNKADQKPDQKQPHPAKPDVKERQIQAQLQKVRARQKEAEEKRKALEAVLGGPDEVDKDW